MQETAEALSPEGRLYFYCGAMHKQLTDTDVTMWLKTMANGSNTGWVKIITGDQINRFVSGYLASLPGGTTRGAVLTVNAAGDGFEWRIPE